VPRDLPDLQDTNTTAEENKQRPKKRRKITRRSNREELNQSIDSQINQKEQSDNEKIYSIDLTKSKAWKGAFIDTDLFENLTSAEAVGFLNELFAPREAF
jgi:hypothetical protein